MWTDNQRSTVHRHQMLEINHPVLFYDPEAEGTLQCNVWCWCYITPRWSASSVCVTHTVKRWMNLCTNWEMHDQYLARKDQIMDESDRKPFSRNLLTQRHADFKGSYCDCCTTTLMSAIWKEARCFWQITSLDPRLLSKIPDFQLDSQISDCPWSREAADLFRLHGRSYIPGLHCTCGLLLQLSWSYRIAGHLGKASPIVYDRQRFTDCQPRLQTICHRLGVQITSSPRYPT